MTSEANVDCIEVAMVAIDEIDFSKYFHLQNINDVFPHSQPVSEFMKSLWQQQQKTKKELIVNF